MTVVRRCIFRDPDEALAGILTYERTLSVTVYRTSFTVYSCMGSRHHESHLIRIEYGQVVRTDSKKLKLIAKQTNPIPKEKRGRLFPKDIMYCPIGKCKLKYQKMLSEELFDHSQDVYRCPGSIKANHHGHYMKVCHGFLQGDFPQSQKVGILIITIEK